MKILVEGTLSPREKEKFAMTHRLKCKACKTVFECYGTELCVIALFAGFPIYGVDCPLCKQPVNENSKVVSSDAAVA